MNYMKKQTAGLMSGGNYLNSRDLSRDGCSKREISKPEYVKLFSDVKKEDFSINSGMR